MADVDGGICIGIYFIMILAALLPQVTYFRVLYL